MQRNLVLQGYSRARILALDVEVGAAWLGGVWLLGRVTPHQTTPNQTPIRARASPLYMDKYNVLTLHASFLETPSVSPVRVNVRSEIIPAARTSRS